MAPFWTSYIFDEIAQLFAQSRENLVFVLDGFYRSQSAYAEGYGEMPDGDIPSKNGISSSLVRSAPSASAIVESRCIAFNRKRTSSCYME
jgi:hypothetical protein